MHIIRRVGILLLCIMLFSAAFPAALAAGPVDAREPTSLTITYQEAGKPLEGVEFRLYLTASMDLYGRLTPTAPFAGLGVDITGRNDGAWRTLASTLEGYVIRDGITPTATGKTNAQGIAAFSTATSALPQGLYLVTGVRHIQDDYIYYTEPFMVQLPGLDMTGNVWDYDVTVYPKYSSKTAVEKDTLSRKVLKVWMDKNHKKDRPEEIEVQLFRDSELYDTVKLNKANDWRHTWSGLDSDHQWTLTETCPDKYTVEIEKEGITFVVTNTHKDYDPAKPVPPGKPSGKLPQTGQLWWPVAALGGLGAVFLVTGLAIRRRRSDYEE